MQWRASFVSLALVLSSQASAVTIAPSFTGNQLADVCLQQSMGEMACTFYISGFRNGVYTDAYLKKQKPDLCLPAEVSNEQLTASFMQFLQDHPEHRHLSAPALFYLMSSKYYECD